MITSNLLVIVLCLIVSCATTSEYRAEVKPSSIKYHDTKTHASHPGNVTLARDKLIAFKEGVDPARINCFPDDLIDEHLRVGDSRAALVMATEPYLLIAAYSDEIDGIAMLRFEKDLSELYNLRKGSRLLTINTYTRRIDKLVENDLVLGPKELGRYSNFYSLIAEFLSNDIDRISQRKNQIDEAEWIRTETFGKEYLTKYGYRSRKGSPYYSMVPAD